MNLASPKQTTRVPHAAKKIMAALGFAPFALGVVFLLMSFCISIASNASNSGGTEVASGVLLLAGLALAIVGAPITALTERGKTSRFAWGLAATAGGSVLAAMWPYIMYYFVFPPYEAAQTACWRALRAVVTRPNLPGHQNVLLPTQIRCQAENVDVPIGLLPGWESWSLTALAFIFMGTAVYGIYLMLTAGRR